MSLDPSDDFSAVCDGLETVTLCRRGSTPGDPGTVVAHALSSGVTMREAAASSGRYTASDVTWHLPVAELPDAPRLGDLIVGGQRRWTVLEVQRTTLGTRWRCIARSLAVVYGLDDTVTILKATYGKGTGGAAEATWFPWKTGVRARIQPVESRTGSRHEALQSVTRFQIFVEEELALDQSHRILAADGRIYKVLGVRGAERIGELQTIDAESTPWPYPVNGGN
jgi:hypothetical protein